MSVVIKYHRHRHSSSDLFTIRGALLILIEIFTRVASRGQRILSVASVPGDALLELGRAVVSDLVCTLNQFKKKFDPMKPAPPVFKISYS